MEELSRWVLQRGASLDVAQYPKPVLYSQMHFAFLSLYVVYYRTRSIFGCQSRRISSSLGSKLHNSAEEIQQPSDRTTPRSGSGTSLRLRRRRIQFCHGSRSHSLFLQELCPILEKTRYSPWLRSTQSWNSHASRSPKICKKRRHHSEPYGALKKQHKYLRYDGDSGLSNAIVSTIHECVSIRALHAYIVLANQPNERIRKKEGDMLKYPLDHKMVISVLNKEWSWCFTAIWWYFTPSIRPWISACNQHVHRGRAYRNHSTQRRNQQQRFVCLYYHLTLAVKHDTHFTFSILLLICTSQIHFSKISYQLALDKIFYTRARQQYYNLIFS